MTDRRADDDQRRRRELAGQGVVYAVALAAVVLLIALMELTPVADASRVSPAREQPPLFPANR